MSLLELFLLAVGLSMDAFAVSVCKGLSVRRGSMKQALTVGIWFGGFQALMPFLGYLLGITFSSLITSIDHWIAFVLLVFIGFNMIREARSDEENESNDRFDFKTMLPLAVATSIDALAVGVTIWSGDQDKRLCECTDGRCRWPGNDPWRRYGNGNDKCGKWHQLHDR